MTTEEFIRKHRNDDVRRLALQASRHSCIDMPYALDQIAGWQTACRKLPSWAATDGIIYPPHISMEQCSSEHTAMYKARLIEDLKKESSTFVDLTGGFGVDFSFMSCGFSNAVYVERQTHLCDAASHNFAMLGMNNVNVVCGDGTDYLHSMDHAEFIFLDPARRDNHGGRTYAISDCTPDVRAMENELLDKADVVMLKLSPMLDITKTVADLENDGHNGVVSDVHIVSVNNECKELLVVLSKRNKRPLAVHCVNINEGLYENEKLKVKTENYQGNKALTSDNIVVKANCKYSDCFSFIPSEYNADINHSYITSGSLSSHESSLNYLYEPNASIMKAGCFVQLCERYRVCGVGRNSHLFVSDELLSCFPGRGFIVKSVTSMNKKELKVALAGITKANIAVRNFPMSVAELRKRLKLSDGGDIYIFATTIESNRHVLFVTVSLKNAAGCL